MYRQFFLDVLTRPRHGRPRLGFLCYSSADLRKAQPEGLRTASDSGDLCDCPSVSMSTVPA